MIEEIIETGKSVEDAIESACQKLGCARDNCEWEIIDLPKKGFLGLKHIPAKVKVRVERPDPAPQPKTEPAQEKRETQPQRQQREPVKAAKPVPEQAPAKEQEREAAPKKASQVPPPVISMNPPTEELGQKAEATKAYLRSILDAMEITQATIDTHWEDGGVYYAIKGEGLGVIIGRRGDTLDSLQYLCGLVANRIEGDYLRVTVDCGDYRVKRKATLEALAHKLSEQVLRTDLSKTLEPMNPFERRIIHSTVSTIEGVSSTSVGEEPNRRVVITSPTAKSPRRSGGGRGRSDGRSRDHGDRGGRDERRGRGRSDGRSRDHGDRGGRDDRRGRDRDRDRDRKPNMEVTPSAPPAKPPTEAENKPLYGKIELDLD